MKKSLVLIAVATVGLAASAAETLYWINSSYGKDWSASGLWYPSAEGGEGRAWADGSVAEVSGHVYIRQGETYFAQGLKLHGYASVWAEAGSELQLGSGGILGQIGGKEWYLTAHDGAIIRLMDNQTWTTDLAVDAVAYYAPFCDKCHDGSGNPVDPVVKDMPVIACAKPLTLTLSKGAAAKMTMYWGFTGDMAGSTLELGENVILDMGLYGAQGSHVDYIQDTHMKAMVNAETLVLNRGAAIQTQSTKSPVSGGYTLAKNLIMRDSTLIKLYWGGRLDFETLTAESGTATIDARSAGSGTLPSRELRLVSKAGASLVMDGSFSGSPTFALAGDGDITLTKGDTVIRSISGFTGKLTLGPGTYEIPPTKEWPETMTLALTDPGNTTLKTAVGFYANDPARIPAGAVLAESQELVVYDTPVAADDLNLVGTTVYVRGNGLTEATRIVRDVDRADDAILAFQRPATVASPILINRGKVVVKNSTEGLARFTGAISVLKIDDTDIDTSFQVNQGVAEVAGGLVVMGKDNQGEERKYTAGSFMVTGDGNMILSSELRLRDASGGVWSTGDSALTVANGGHIVTEWTPDGCVLQACGGGNSSTAAIIKILEGGRITLDNNATLRLGENTYQKVGRLVIDGGELITQGNGGAIRSDCDNTAEGTRSAVEFRRGTITLTRSFESHNNSGIVDFLWSGGTIRYPVGDGTALNKTDYFREVLFKSEGYAVQILGDVTLDFTDGDFPAGLEFKAAQYWNNTIGWSTANPLPWRGNGRLHLVDRKPRGMTFVVNAQAENAMDEKWPTFVSDSVNVKVVTAASTPLSAHGIGLGSGTVTVVDAADQSVALNADELVIAGANCSATQVAASALTASEATVLAGGVWRNATWSALSLTTLSFEAGSVFEFDGTPRTLTTLALPETMTYRVAPTAKSGLQNAALVATTVEKGDSLVWTPDVGVRPREVVLSTAGGNSQVYLKGGLLLIFR